MQSSTQIADRRFEHDGFCLLKQAVPMEAVCRLASVCDEAFAEQTQGVLARSSRGHVYAARNLIDFVPEVTTVWCNKILCNFLRQQLGDGFGLVRALFFDKPPDRTWALPWHNFVQRTA